MRGSVPTVAVAVSLLGLAAACGNTVPTTASTPIPIIDTQTQTLTASGSVVFPFTEIQAGQVIATLSTIAPDSGLTLQLDLGTWDGAACTIVVTANPAVQGSSATGTANGSGQLCARVSDPSGQIKTTESVTVTISHF